MKEYDIIELTLPFKKEYVSVARLSTAAILNRVGFDIDTIEDVKVCISEVCNIFLNNNSGEISTYSIVYNVGKDYLKVFFKCQDERIWEIFNKQDDEIGLSILKALIEDIEYYNKGEEYILNFIKHI